MVRVDRLCLSAYVLLAQMRRYPRMRHKVFKQFLSLVLTLAWNVTKLGIVGLKMGIVEDLQNFADEMAAAYSICDAAACAEMFTEDGELHSAFGPPAIGRAAIEALHRDWAAEPSQKSMTVASVGQSGDMAWALLRFSEESVTGDGTSLCVFERADKGEWLIKMCCLHGDDVSTDA